MYLINCDNTYFTGNDDDSQLRGSGKVPNVRSKKDRQSILGRNSKYFALVVKKKCATCGFSGCTLSSGSFSPSPPESVSPYLTPRLLPFVRSTTLPLGEFDFGAFSGQACSRPSVAGWLTTLAMAWVNLRPTTRLLFTFSISLFSSLSFRRQFSTLRLPPLQRICLPT